MKPRYLFSLLLSPFLVGVCLLGVPAQESDDVGRITVDELKALLADGKPVTVIDVRNDIDKKIKGAVNVPLDQTEARLAEIPRDREIVTYCA